MIDIALQQGAGEKHTVAITTPKTMSCWLFRKEFSFQPGLLKRIVFSTYVHSSINYHMMDLRNGPHYIFLNFFLNRRTYVCKVCNALWYLSMVLIPPQEFWGENDGVFARRLKFDFCAIKVVYAPWTVFYFVLCCVSPEKRRPFGCRLTLMGDVQNLEAAAHRYPTSRHVLTRLKSKH